MQHYQLRNGRWRGVDRQSAGGTMDRAMSRLDNCYVSQDGLQIRRWPGWRCIVDLTTLNSWRASRLGSRRVNGVTTHVHTFESERVRHWAFEQVRGRLIIMGECDHARQKIADGGFAELAVASWAAGTPGTVTLTGTPQGPREPAGVGVQAPATAYATGDCVYFEGTGSAELDGQFHRVASVAGAVLTLEPNLATSGTSAAAGRVYRVRQHRNPTLGHVPATKSLLDPDALAIWTMRDLPTPGTPLTTCTPAVSIDRRPDYGDDPLGPWPYLEGFRGVSRRRPRTVPIRPAVDVAADRILLASPSGPVVWQIPVILPVGIGVLDPDLTNDVHDAPRSLGVPKGLLFAPGLKDQARGTFAAAGILGQGLPAGTYTFQVMYRDDATGETGLPSEPVTYTVADSSLNPILWVPHPAYYFPECAALSVMILATPTSAPETGLHRTVRLPSYGRPAILPATGATMTSPDLAGFFERIMVGTNSAVGRTWSRADLTFDFDPGTLRQMPMGCNAVRSVRAFTFFGGHRGSAGEAKQIDTGRISSGYQAAELVGGNPNLDRSQRGQEVFLLNFAADGEVWDGGFRGQRGALIYPAYAGQRLVLIDQLFPNGELSVTLGKMLNPYAATADAASYAFPDGMVQRWSLLERVYQQDWATQANKRAAMVMPSGFYQYSEPDNPGAVPNTANGYIDAGQDDDVTAIGRAPGVTIFCTRTQTFALYWEKSPNGQSPVTLSTEHGCIAPNSMVEFPGGCAWMSDRGPVVYRVGGGVDWVGQRIAADFVGSAPRYVRDLDGQMHLCWSAHDRDRGLLLWGVRSNRFVTQVRDPDGTMKAWADASPELRTKFPADEVIAYSYRADALSHWLPPQGMQVFWMRPVECVDRIQRMSFLAEDGRVYALDDAWHDGSLGGGAATAAASQTSSTAFVAAANAFNLGSGLVWSNDSYCRVGQEFSIFDPRTRALRANGTITAVGSATAVTLSKACSWQAGDIFVWGFQSMVVETRQESWLNSANAKSVRRLDVRYESVAMSALTGTGASNQTGAAWLDAFARDGRGAEVAWRDPLLDSARRLVGERAGALEPAGTRVVPRSYHLTAANNAVGDNLSIGLTVIGPAQVRIIDAEVAVDEVSG